MGRVALVMLVGGGVLAYVGYKEYRLSKKVQATAQRITAADLASKGPGDNAHVQLVDYVFTENFVYEANKDNKSNWTKVWFPAVSPNVADPSVFHIIVMSDKIKNTGDAQRAEKSNLLTGVVINEIDSLGSEETKLLKEGYPNVNLDKVWIVEHNRKLPTTTKGMLMGVGGLVLFVGGGAMLLGSARSK